MARTADAVATARALTLLAAIDVGIRTRPLPQVCRLARVRMQLHGPMAAPGVVSLDERERRRVRAAERALAWWPAPDTCLRRSLLLAVLLAPRSPVMRLGWRLDPAPPVAHAWLEIDGRSLDRDLTGISTWEAPRDTTRVAPNTPNSPKSSTGDLLGELLDEVVNDSTSASVTSERHLA